MSRRAIRNALEAALNSMTPALSIAWENVDFTPVNGVPYQKANLLFAQPGNPEFGSNYVEMGIFQITLLYPLSTGSSAADARAELLVETFKRGSSFSAGGYTIVVDRTPEASGGVRDGDRWSVPVKIRWHTNISI